MHEHAMSITCSKCGTKLNCDGEDKPSDRIERVKLAADRTARLKDWIAFFRHPGEQGLGDTVKRLKSLAGKRAIKDDLRRIERICGCETSVAIQKLNEQHPYS